MAIEPNQLNAPEMSGKPSYELDLNDDKGLVEFLARVESSASGILSEWYERATLNLAWAQGRQYKTYSNVTGLGAVNLIETDPRYTGTDPKPYVATNFLRRFVLSQIARVISSPFTWRATSKTSDAADEISASALDRMLPMWFDELDVDGTDFMKSLWKFFVTGVIFAHPYWDPDEGGDDITVSAEEMQSEIDPFVEGLGTEAANLEEGELFERFMDENHPDIDLANVQRGEDGSMTMPKGFMALEWLSGFDVIEDPLAKSWKDSRWVIIRRRLPVEQVRDRYGKKANHVRGLSRGADSRYRESAREQLIDQKESQGVFETTVVISFWLKPGAMKTYKAGMMVDVCEGKVLNRVKYPYNHGQLPVIPIYADPDDDDIRPFSVFDDLMPLQEAFNQVDSQIVSHIDKTVDPGWLSPKGSLEDPDIFPGSGEALTIYELVDGEKPEANKPEQMARHVIHQKAMLRDQIEDLSGTTNPAQGKPDSKASSGRAILALNERFDMLFAPTRRSIKLGLEKIAQQIVALWAQFESGKKDLLTKYGAEGRYELVTLTGGDLISKHQNRGRMGITKFDVKMELGDVPSRAIVIDWIAQMIELGILHPVQHSDIIAQALNDGRIPKLDKRHVDRVNAADENEKMFAILQSVEGGETEPDTAMRLAEFEFAPGEHHPTHMDTHFAFAKGGRLKELSPKSRALGIAMVRKHVQTHQQALVDAMRSQAELAGGEPSNPSPGGGGNGTVKTGAAR